MASMYDIFQTDENLETGGIWLDYGDFRILIASAGQGNKKYIRIAERALKPIRRAMQAGAVSNERSMVIMSEVYAKSIILNWQVKVDGEWKVGIDGPEGELLPFNEEEVIKTFGALPNLFLDVQEQAQSTANFRKLEQETDTKN